MAATDETSSVRSFWRGRMLWLVLALGFAFGIVFGFGGAGFWALATIITTSRYGRDRQSVMFLLSMASGVGTMAGAAAMGPYAIGLVGHCLGLSKGIWCMPGFALVLAAMAFWAYGRARKRANSDVERMQSPFNDVGVCLTGTMGADTIGGVCGNGYRIA